MVDYPVLDFHRVADRPDAWIAGAHLWVDTDSASFADLQSGLSREFRFRANTDCEDHQIRAKRCTSPGAHNETAVTGLLEPRDPISQLKMGCMSRHTPPHKIRHLRIERRHQLVRHLDDGDFEAPMDQVLSHLQPDETAPHDDRPMRVPGFYPLPDILTVGEVAQSENAGEVNARQWRTDGGGAGREHEGIVWLAIFALAVDLANHDVIRMPVDGDDFIPNANLNIEALAK